VLAACRIQSAYTTVCQTETHLSATLEFSRKSFRLSVSPIRRLGCCLAQGPVLAARRDNFRDSPAIEVVYEF
jgi:hypothetical protein